MRGFGALVLCLVGCGSSGPKPVETIIPDLAATGRETALVGASAVEPPVAAPLVSGVVEAPSGPDDGQEAPSASICDVDPSLCQPMTKQMVAACHCSPAKTRSAQQCLIDCVARERKKVDKELKAMGP